MSEKRVTLNHELIRRLAAAGTAGLLVFLLILSWLFNIAHDAIWFLRAAAFMVAGLYLAWRLCLHIHVSWLRSVIAVVSVEILVLYSTGRLVSFYYQGESFNEEFLFHLSPETLSFALTAFGGLATLEAACLLLAGVLAYFSVHRLPVVPDRQHTWILLPGLLFAPMLDPDLSRLASFALADRSRNDMLLTDIDWEGSGLKREALYRMSDDIIAGKNVVMIYLESVEQMYTDETIFPGLTPFLNSLKDSTLLLDNIQQTRGTNFTVAGILSSQCGTPLLFPNGPGGNDILKNGFLQEGFCFGDILSAAGYRQVFMGGASTRFAGKGVFLAAHGYDEILGKEELLPRLQDQGYLNNWGLFDDSLLPLAMEKFDELAANPNQPFNFTVLTVDTHPPDGTVSESCEPYPLIDNNIFHAVHCTDQLLEKFVEHLRQSPAWDDTVVMIMSDHLHMRNTGMDFYPPDYERKLFVSFLNAGVTGRINTSGTHMDIAPTLLSLMGVQHQQAFLAGDDLLIENIASRPDPTSVLRMNAIRYINTNLLSRIETGLCEAEPLYSMQNNSLRVGGREIDLSMRGRPLPLNVLGTTNALMTLVSNEGKVGLTFPVDLNNLSYVMFQFRENSFLLLVPHAPVRELFPDLEPYDGLGVVFGNLQDGFEVLHTKLSLRDGFEVNSDCEDLLDKSRALTGEGVLQTLGNLCENTVPVGNVWDDREGKIRLNSVAYADQRFQVVLTRNNRGWYSVANLEDLIPLPQEPEEGSCDAYYGNMEILIPGIQTPDGPSSMLLEKIPGIPLTFEMGTTTPLAETR